MIMQKVRIGIKDGYRLRVGKMTLSTRGINIRIMTVLNMPSAATGTSNDPICKSI
jgi:hypothetical protein